MKKKSAGLLLLIFLSALVLSMMKTEAVSAADQKYSVLFLSSYTYSFSSVPSQIEGVKQALSANEYSIDYEFMDTKRFSSDKNIEDFHTYMRNKIDLLPKYDAIIAGDDAALSFVLKYRDDLFEGIPVVFLGINNISFAKQAAMEPGVTGVVEKAAYQDNINLIRKLFPFTKKIVAVTDDTQTGKGDQEQFHNCAADNPDLDFSMIDASELSSDELAQKISETGSNSVILYLTLFEDADGNAYTVDSGAAFIAGNAKVPVFRLSIGGIGEGVLGGILISYEKSGELAGNMVSSIMSGTDPGSIALEEECPTYGLFDGNIMEKYGILSRELPKGSTVINEHTSFYSAHRTLCNIVLLITSFMCMVIWILFVNVRRQKKLIAAQKDAEEKLRESQETLREAITSSDIQYFTYFPERKRIEIYALNQKYSGMATEWDNFPDSFIDYVKMSDDDAGTYRDMVKKIDDGKASSSCIVQMLYRGSYSWIRVSMTAIKDGSGKTVKAQAFSDDITMHKKEMDDYERELSGFGEACGPNMLTKGHINLSRDLIISYIVINDDEGRSISGQSYTKAYRYFIENTAVPSGEKTLDEMIERDELIRRCRAGEKEIKVKYRRYMPNRAPVWMSTEIKLYASPDTGDAECFIYTYDVTEKVLEEHIIKKLPDFGYESIGFAYPQYGAVISYILNGKDSSAGYMRSGKYNDTLRRIINVLLRPDQQDAAWNALNIDAVVEKLKADEVYIYSFATIDIYGNAFQKQMRYSFLDDNRDTVFFCMSDVSKQYEAEHRQIAALESARLDAEKANEAKSTFLSGMSHDLRTPLNGIIGFTSLALEEKDTDKKQDYLEKIKYSGALLLNLVNDTLELSRIESGKMELIYDKVKSSDIWNSVLTALRPEAELKNISLETDIRVDPDEVTWGDRLKLQKIFLNLLSNAIKFTPEGGRVRLTVEEEDEPGSRCNRRITVEDNGIGMSAEFQKILYEPFAQEHRSEVRNISGTGLGLTIVKKITDLMGGRITVRSAVGKGTEFTVYLPIQFTDEKPEGEEYHGGSISFEGRHILLCEDNYLNAEIASTLLKSKGTTVEWAENGKAGVEKILASDEGYYDAVLMDIHMPEMDGYEATAAIRAMERNDTVNMPVIAMTADAFNEDIKRCLAAGMNAHISKPVDPERLFSVLGEFFDANRHA